MRDRASEDTGEVVGDRKVPVRETSYVRREDPRGALKSPPGTENYNLRPASDVLLEDRLKTVAEDATRRIPVASRISWSFTPAT